MHPLVSAATAGLLPGRIAHIARDPMDPAFDLDAAVAAIRRRRTELKRRCWTRRWSPGSATSTPTRRCGGPACTARGRPRRSPGARAGRCSTAAAEVMDEALAPGGTSFDALYVNVNGASGYFDRSLAAYGQADGPCPRCGTPIRREPFMNRSSFSCPRCQPAPRARVRRGGSVHSQPRRLNSIQSTPPSSSISRTANG